MRELIGILVIDKPRGWTSHDVTKKARNLLGGVKIGHTGTLDPNATGVLVLLIGKATKMAKYFEKDTKRYEAVITFGWATDTYDSNGRTTATGDYNDVDIDYLQEVIDGFSGESEQIPPMYSAVKVNGKRLYQLARMGKTITRKSRTIQIDYIKSDLTDYPRIMLDIVCSKGTYIRSIAHQLGEKVGCPSHLSALRRTSSGKYTVEEAVDFLSIAESSDDTELIRLIKPVPEFLNMQ